MSMKNPAAVALGKMAKGVPKNFSAAERNRRRKLIEAINKKRRSKLGDAKAANDKAQRRRDREASSATET